MSDQNVAPTADLVGLTADIVSAYVSQNPLPVAGLPDLIASIHSSLSNLGQPSGTAQPTQDPAINPKRSVTPDYIICLEDGKRFKSLKRHLAVHYGLTPDEYREKWGLKQDYPMVAPNYAAQRSTLAKAAGLGRKPQPTPAKKAPAKRKPRCLIPGFDGALFSLEWRDALWDRFYMAAPRRQRQSVEQYKIVKRA